MKEKIAMMVISAICICHANGQKTAGGKLHFSAGVEAGIPVGTEGITLFYPFAGGVSLQAQRLLSPDFGLTLKAGFLNYFSIAGGVDFGMIPVLTGFRYRFSRRIFGSAQLGVSFATLKREGAFFSYSPGVGLNISRHLDLLARYEAASKGRRTYGTLGGRLAYKF